MIKATVNATTSLAWLTAMGLAFAGTALATSTGAATATAAAISASEAQDPSADILARLRTAYPATRFDTVRPSEIPGLYEVAMGRNLAYIEPRGRYFVFGHIYDMPANTDLTAMRASRLQPVATDRLPAADGFVVRRGDNPTYRVSVFSDPACGYCRVLEKTLASLPEVEVTVYLLPLQDGADERAARVWCSADRARAWQAEMLGTGAAPVASSSCDTSVFARNRGRAGQLGVRGTPALISSDGRIQSGAMERLPLLAWLSRSSTAQLSERVTQ
jgi:thiol:disulfide interchange protein DsbC